MKNENSARLNFTLTPAELELFKKGAHKAECTLSAFMRLCANKEIKLQAIENKLDRAVK